LKGVYLVRFSFLRLSIGTFFKNEEYIVSSLRKDTKKTFEKRKSVSEHYPGEYFKDIYLGE